MIRGQRHGEEDDNGNDRDDDNYDVCEITEFNCMPFALTIMRLQVKTSTN